MCLLFYLRRVIFSPLVWLCEIYTWQSMWIYFCLYDMSCLFTYVYGWTIISFLIMPLIDIFFQFTLGMWWKKINITWFVNVLFVLLQSLLAEFVYLRPNAKTNIHKRRFLDALVLTLWESRKFHLIVRNKATGTPCGFVYDCFVSRIWEANVFSIQWRGAFCVARFDYQGNARAFKE